MIFSSMWISKFQDIVFDRMDRRPLQRLGRVWGPDEQEVELALQGLGQPEDFGDSPLLARFRAWVSRTPFLPMRHPKCMRADVAGSAGAVDREY